MDYEHQQTIFSVAISLGWTGEIPIILGTPHSDQLLEEAKKYIELCSLEDVKK